MFMKKKPGKIRWSAIFLSVVLLVSNVCFSCGESSESGTAAADDVFSAVNGEEAEEETEEAGETAETVTAGSVITQGGEYRLDSRASQGVVHIRTSDPVTIEGSGINGSGNDYLTIDCEKENADLTIRNLRIDNATEMAAGAIRFTGKGNRLTLEGQNLLQQCYNEIGGRAVIRVPAGSELTIGGDGELYMYKHSYQNAGIGGDEGEAGGTVIIEGGKLRIMGINGGALIGSDKSAGDVFIRGGDVSLWADSRQTAIGGYGSAPGGNISVSGGVLSLEGGRVLAGGGSDSTEKGTFSVSGGRIVTENPSKVTADVMAVNSDGISVPAAVFSLDLSDVFPDGWEGQEFEISVDGRQYYSGTMTYCTYDIASASEGASNPDTWKETDSSVFNLYLAKEDHVLSLNGKTFDLSYDTDSGEFSLSEGEQSGDEDNGGGTGDADGPDSGSDSGGGSSGGSGGAGGGGTPAVYPVSVTDTANGSTTVSPSAPSKGKTVTVTPDPDERYEVDEITVTDRNGDMVEITDNGDGTYSFKQPAGSVTVSVTFRSAGSVSDCPRDESCPMCGFADLNRSAWYHDGVHYCLENGLMAGVSDAAFHPGDTTTRAQLVTILWRLEGEPVVNDLTDFSDVPDDTWYSEAVRWAAGEGIAEGFGSGLFGSEETIDREQTATLLYRYARYKGYDVSASADLLEFSDASDISGYARDAMGWAKEEGLIYGTDAKTLNPKGESSRAQVASILMRFCENIAVPSESGK